ncbi:MAG: D-glycero-beta-D-manno-heptose 1-phosphate adenylyltransferase [Proteobacteria bacterium]|nr:D-glycero-beta-D-manno-heptose 1-phosphate adenylyltransferase [Desulfobacula sp.]MBU3950520.1 D-glycero-beta-D-manno-heptose 1-phosphate adenylyltransferase [Pseudomonadota bacterium]MBU4132956.1 D-glycero-beta-D-manno-heptose 1-phosphate adenylyltransferase [Pseudomonadota bacterium]
MDNKTGKIVGFDEIRSLADVYRAGRKRIVFTNGCFDILHAGHVSYLSMAAALGDVLVVGLNSDLSVKRIKGEKRPIIGEAHRACVMSALEFVDHVVLFDDPDPGQLIETICPDILVKGADWTEDKIVGAAFVRENGGRVERIVLEPDISTTKIIERIGRLYYGQI